MPPKSKNESEVKTTEGAPPSSRRSARIAATPSSAKDPREDTKKRSGEQVDSKSTSTKKAKTESSTSKSGKVEVEVPSKSKTSSKTKTKGTGKDKDENKDIIEDESTRDKAREEKKEEAPASAKPTTSGSKVLVKGDKLPSIELLDEEGAKVDVGKLAGEKGIVIFLYPKADTPGCTNQACGFRDHFSEIQKLGYEVYGLSKDKPAAQKRWKEKKSLTYSLLSDPDSKLIKRLGAFVAPNNTKRSHFIFEKGSGGLVDIAIGVKPAEDPKKCLEFIEKHHA